MIIDAHNHAGYHGFNYERFIANMDQFNIDKTWILSWEAPVGDFDPNSIYAFPLPMAQTSELGIANSGPVPFYLGLFYKMQAPDRFILGYAPDPRRPDAIQRLKGAVNTYGVQVCGEVKLRMMYDNPDAIDMFRWCGANGLPVTLHFDYPIGRGSAFPRPNWWYGGDIDTLERVLKLCPGTNFLGHAPGFWCHISNDSLGETESYPRGPVIPGGKIEVLLDTYPNLYCDCSAGSARIALTRDPEYTKNLILAHPDRFVYARDYFDNELAPFIDGLGLPAEVLEAFYHGNAERLAAPVKNL